MNNGDIFIRQMLSVPAKQMLLEMAISLKDFRIKVDGLRFQLVENWCLCKWCQMFDPENNNFIHWAKELSTHMSNLKFLILKAGDKRKTLRKMLIIDYDYDDPSMILQIINDKFTAEKIVNLKQKKAVAEKFSLGVLQLIDAIVDETKSIATYVKHTFVLENDNETA